MDEALPPGSLGGLLNQTAACARQLASAYLAPHGITLPQWLVLNALWDEDGQTVGSLSAHAHAKKAAASRLIDRMEQAGLVRKQASGDDARSVLVFLTPDGAAKAHLRQMQRHVGAALLAGFGREDAEAAFALLRRLLANGKAAIEGVELPEEE